MVSSQDCETYRAPVRAEKGYLHSSFVFSKVVLVRLQSQISLAQFTFLMIIANKADRKLLNLLSR